MLKNENVLTNRAKFYTITVYEGGCFTLKHIFVVNPAAGKQDATEYVKNAVEGLNVDYEIYKTKCQGDATRYVEELAKTGEQYRVYACGGDGTFNEVASGAVDKDNISVSVFPCGSGNDYIKYYGSVDEFKDIESLVNGVDTKIDIMKVHGRYAVNFVHFGFDSACLMTMSKVRRKKIIGGKHAYTTGVVTALINGMKHRCIVKVDGKQLGGDKMLLCTVGNGKFVGGKYKCAPLSDNADGLLEICHVNPVSRLRFLTLIGAYEKGTHLDDKRFEKYVNYTRGTVVEVESTTDEEMHFSIDGELHFAKNFKVEILKHAVNFVVPLSIHNKHFAEKGDEAVVN